MLRHPLGTVTAALLVAAGLLWGASRLDWLRPVYDTPLRGRVVVDVTGGTWQPVLVPLAVLALAGVAGVLATGGAARRVVGLLLGAAGIWALVLAARVSAVGPAAVAGLSGTPAAGRPAAVDALVSGPLLAGLAGLALLAAGAALVVRGAAIPRLGARFSASAPRRALDPDRGLWDAQDAGVDLTDLGTGQEGDRT